MMSIVILKYFWAVLIHYFDLWCKQKLNQSACAKRMDYRYEWLHTDILWFGFARTSVLYIAYRNITTYFGQRIRAF